VKRRKEGTEKRENGNRDSRRKKDIEVGLVLPLWKKGKKRGRALADDEREDPTASEVKWCEVLQLGVGFLGKKRAPICHHTKVLAIRGTACGEKQGWCVKDQKSKKE